ncbi:MAG: hypothetical protein WA919_06680 [Coleofasciculaceae cyanobacterium]
MASEQQVKRYLAYWLQLGKKIVIPKMNLRLSPPKVISGESYSKEFEEIWQLVLSQASGDCHLEGTSQTIAQLLTAKWDLEPCARCEMPVPIVDIGLLEGNCTCSDLPSWPNTEIPAPREPVNNRKSLSQIRDRLQKARSN